MPATSRVYIGGLPYGTSERDVERFFRGYGRIRDVLLKNGYGFIEFDDHRDAEDACYELNGKRLLGERISVERARGAPRGRDRDPRDRERDHKSARERARDKYGPPTRTKYRIIVENLSSRVSWQDLKDHMRSAGEVTYADAHKEHKNEGVVEFASYSDMRNAIEKLDDTELSGRRIKVYEDKSSKPSKRSESGSSRSRSRSRSPRKSRSRSRSRSKSRSASKSKSRSRSPKNKSSRSRSRSRRSPAKGDARGGSKDRSRSRSPRDSRSRSKSN